MSSLRLTFLRILLVLLLFTICRLFFWVYNSNNFDSFGFVQILEILIKGIRFDFSVISLINLPIFVTLIIDFILGKNYSRLRILSFYYIGVNSLAILLNFIDSFWFKYIQKRAGTGLFSMLEHGDTPIKLILAALKDYWWGIIPLGIFIYLLYLVNKKGLERIPPNQQRYIYYIFLFIAIPIIGIRGGLQLRPISVANASDCSHPNGSQIILNAPFCIIQELVFPGIEVPNYIDPEHARLYISGSKKPHDFLSPAFPVGTNFIFIITESLSAEYCGFLNSGKGYTPFLDSLSNHTIIADHCYASGKQSIEGIPALISGIPAFLNEPMMTSIYAANKIPSIPNSLKPYHYHCAFFHGGKNGTMNFDLYTKHAGFDNYYGKNEYSGSVADDDGQWGIFDEPFGVFTAQTIKQLPRPYLATWFTLSSHQPYIIPKKLRGQFSKGDEEIHESIGYADYALREFFDQLKKEGLLNDQTCIIITADHTGPASRNNHSRSEQHHIPMMIYYRGMSGHIAETVSQTDLPEIILKGIPHPTGLFSNKSTHPPYAYNYYNQTWQMISDSGSFEFNGKEIFQRTGKPDETAMLQYLKAYIVTHHDAMKNNRLVP